MASSASANEEHFVEGKYVQVTYQNESIDGVVWSYDKENGLLSLQTLSPTGDVEIVMLVASCISSIIPMAVTASTPKKALKIIHLSNDFDVNAARRAEEKKVQIEMTKASGINTAVSPLAQEIFNRFLHLNISCIWEGQDIAIPGSNIKVSPPYTTSDCTFTAPTSDNNKALLERVQKIVASVSSK